MPKKTKKETAKPAHTPRGTMTITIVKPHDGEPVNNGDRISHAMIEMAAWDLLSDEFGPDGQEAFADRMIERMSKYSPKELGDLVLAFAALQESAAHSMRATFNALEASAAAGNKDAIKQMGRLLTSSSVSEDAETFDLPTLADAYEDESH